MSSKVHYGRLVAATLAGAWRASPPPLILNGELASIAPMLLHSGSAPLAWWRLRGLPHGSSELAVQLRDAYYWHSVEAGLHDRAIRAAIEALRSRGVEPLLAKGWAVARLYPAPGLRPYGDVDLCIRPEQRVEAEAVLARLPPTHTPVDLHHVIVDLPDRSFDALYERSCTADLGDMTVRILGMEDHLRFLCLHLLRHGARRPLWLCDVGVMLEALPADFDWGYFMEGDRHRTDWSVGVLGLASQLLSTRLDYGPVAHRAQRLPDWLVPAVLRQWGDTFRPRNTRLMRTALRRPQWLLNGIRERWPNQIEATYWLDGPIDARLRLAYQLRAFLGRTVSFAMGRRHGEH